MKRSLFPDHSEQLNKTCKKCNKKFSNRSGDYCSRICAEDHQSYV